MPVIKTPWQDRESVFWVKEFGSAAAKTKPVPTTREQVVAIIKDFLDNAYISGVALASRRDIHILDRCFWISMIVLCAALTAATLPGTYQTVASKPSMVEVVTSTKSVFAFPFPTVMICPKVKIRKTVALDYLMKANNLTTLKVDRVLPALRFLQSFRLPYWLGVTSVHIDPYAVNLFANVNMKDFLTKVAVPCESLFASCSWEGNRTSCCEGFFKRIMSNLGLCFAFNSLTTFDAQLKCPVIPFNEARDEEYGIWYDNRPKTPECQLRSTGAAGIMSALEVLLQPTNPADVLTSGRGSMGYDVVVLTPNEGADALRGMYVPENDNMMTSVPVTYSETTAEVFLRRLKPEHRDCLFEDEQPVNNLYIKAMPWYTQDRCIEMCRVNFLVQQCHCAPYFDFDSDNICRLEQYECIVRNSRRMMWILGPDSEDRNVLDKEERERVRGPDCRPCQPMCSMSVYRANYRRQRVNFLMPTNSAAYINVFYRDLHSATHYKERESYSVPGLLLTYGGAINLLLGVSLMTAVQIVFYAGHVALVLCGSLRSQLQHYWLRGRAAWSRLSLKDWRSWTVWEDWMGLRGWLEWMDGSDLSSGPPSTRTPRVAATGAKADSRLQSTQLPFIL